MNGSHGAILKSGKEMSSIFEDIEELYIQDECLKRPSKSTMLANISSKEYSRLNLPNQVETDERSAQRTRVYSEDVNWNFLPACSDSEFLTSSDTQTLPEDELSLYSVNQNELHPVIAPFMVPGIYKKIGNTQVSLSKQKNKPNNVVVTTKASNGKIVSRTNFEGHMVSKPSKERHVCGIEKNITINETSFANVPSDNLLKFAYSIYKTSKMDRIIINRERKEISRSCANNNQQIIYRLLGPEEFNLVNHFNDEQSLSTAKSGNRSVKRKIGRPKKRIILEDCNNTIQVKSPENLITEKSKQEDYVDELDSNCQKYRICTRSGRPVKPRSELNIASLNKLSDVDYVKDLVNDSKDKDFRENIQLSSKSVEENTLSKHPHVSCSDTKKRRVPPESICPKCGKIFLGRRLKRHFVQYPDHMSANGDNSSILEQPYPVDTDMTLFRYLTLKLQKPSLNEDQRAELFLSELNDLVAQLQLRSTRLIRNTSGLHFICARTSRVLGIPEGQYALDMSAMDAGNPLIDIDHVEELKRHQSIASVVTVSNPSLDYTAISLDDTLTDEAAQKLNLSAGGKLLPPSEESLLRAVGDLVHDGIPKLVDTNMLHPPRTVVQYTGVSTSVQHYDHVSDNAVEALSIKSSNAQQEGTSLLDLSVDFFKFKNN